jgi:predicted nucleic acid-binding Zn ribbon protein
MTYHYQCEKCEKVMEKAMEMMDEHPKFLKCECGGKAYRQWGSIHIPDHFKATSNENDANNPASLDSLKTRFGKSYPSGRTSKIYY